MAKDAPVDAVSPEPAVIVSEPQSIYPASFGVDVAKLCLDILNTPSAGPFHGRAQALLTAATG